jgi:hypothetical protein
VKRVPWHLIAVAALLAVALLLLGPIMFPPAHSTEPFQDVADPCLPRDRLIAQLGQQYHETQGIIGLRRDGATMMEVFVSPEGTWSILQSTDMGHGHIASCIVDAGDNFRIHTDPVSGPKRRGS